jgi:transposase InsO family protein
VREQQRQIADLRQQREILKKNAGHCQRGALERYQRIEEMKTDYPTEVLCEAFCVSRSGFYDWLERRSNPSARAKEDVELAEQIREVHQQSRGTYGTPRLQAELRHRGHKHSRKRIDRIRRELGLSGRPKRHYRPQTTDSSHQGQIAPNRLAELPKATRLDQILVSDLTYIPTEEGWLYLAVIMDLYSRRIIGGAFAHHLGSELVAAALAMALVHRRPPEGLIHHSDRGVQYASAAYRKLLEAHGVMASMSRKGYCYDNAAMEAFFSTLKVECVYRTGFPTHQKARGEIFSYIESFYNRRRRHSALG